MSKCIFDFPLCFFQLLCNRLKAFFCLEQGQGDIPTFYTYEEGLSHLTAEGQATLERLEGMLSQSVSSQYNMAGVRTEDSVRDYEGEFSFSLE